MFLNINGVRLHVVEFGTGDRTILAIGGWTGSWEMWQESLSLLSATGWRCIAFDHRESGESPAFVFFTLPILLSKKRIRSEPIMTSML